MNAYGIVLKPAKLDLLLFVLSVAIAFIVVIGLARYHTEKQQSILQKEQQLAAAHDSIVKLTYDLDTINRLAEKYQRLTHTGFIGEPDRDVWVQRLEAIYRDTRLPPTLRYTLAPPQLFNPQPDDAQLAYQNNVSHHDLALELSGIHDGEFLDFIARLHTDWLTPYRFDTCQIAREAEAEPIIGLQIKCTVELYSLPDKTAKTAP